MIWGKINCHLPSGTQWMPSIQKWLIFTPPYFSPLHKYPDPHNSARSQENYNVLFWLNSCLSIRHFSQVTKYNHHASSCFCYAQFYNNNPFHPSFSFFSKAGSTSKLITIILSQTKVLEQYVLINSYLHRRYQNISFTNV